MAKPKPESDPGGPGQGPKANAPGEAAARRCAVPAPESVRIECLKIAAELRTVQAPVGTLIQQAKELELYVTGAPPETGN